MAGKPISIDMGEYFALAQRLERYTRNPEKFRNRSLGVMRGALNDVAKEIKRTARAKAMRGKRQGSGRLKKTRAYYSKVAPSAIAVRVQAGRSRRLPGGNVLSNHVGAYVHYPHWGTSTSERYGRRDFMYRATIANKTFAERRIVKAESAIVNAVINQRKY